MSKSEEKIHARNLRRNGESIKIIAKRLHVSVASVSSWCRDIELSIQQIENLSKRVKDPYYGKKGIYISKKKKELDKKISNLKNVGIRQIGKLTKRELFLVGVALYWAEGFKKDHQVGFATSDINMAKLFIIWLKRCFLIRQKDLILRVTANISYREKIHALENYWSKCLQIPVGQFSKPFFQKSIWKKKYEDENDYHGVLRIKVKKSVDFLRKIYGYIEGISLNIK